MSAACRTGYEKRPSLSFVLASSSRASVSSDRLSLDCVFVFFAWGVGQLFPLFSSSWLS